MFSLQVLYIRKGESGERTEDENVPYGLQTLDVDVFGNNAAKFRFIQKVPVGLGLLEMDVGKRVFIDPLFQNGGLGDFFRFFRYLTVAFWAHPFWVLMKCSNLVMNS